MRTYEMMVIFHPTLDESAVATEVEKVSELLKANGGKVAKVTVWGRRKLAYAINNQMEGSYVLFYFEMEPSALAGFEFNLKLDENILRYVVLKIDGISVAEPAAEAEEAAVEVEDAPVAAEAEADPVVAEEAEEVAEEEAAPDTAEESAE